MHWIVLVFMGSIIGGLAISMLYLHFKTRQNVHPPRISNPAETARKLGFSYEADLPVEERTSHGGLGKQWEIIKWRIAGEYDGRPVKLEHKYTRTRGTMDTSVPDVPHTSLEVPCNTPPDFFLFLSRTDYEFEEKGQKKISMPRKDRPDKKLNGRVQGKIDVDKLRSLDLVEMICYSPEPGPSNIEIIEGRAVVHLNFGNRTHELEETVVDRAVKTAVEFVEKVEQLEEK